LENEMAHHTWVVAAVPEDLLDHAQEEIMWRTMLGRVGAEWRLLADEPDDPAAN